MAPVLTLVQVAVRQLESTLQSIHGAVEPSLGQ